MAKSKIESAVGVSSSGATVSGVGQGFARPPDDHEIYNLIGRVSSEWAHLEHMLDRIIWDLAGIEPYIGACITAQMIGIPPRTSSIIALLTHQKSDFPRLQSPLNQIHQLVKDCRGPTDHRNRVIHDPWYSEQCDENHIAQHKSMPKGNLVYGLEDKQKEDLVSLIKRIDDLSKKTTMIKNEVATILTTSQ